MENNLDVYKNYTSTIMLANQDEDALTRWSIGYFRALLAPHLPQDRGARILEIGCGYGRNIIALQKLGYTNVRGIDISEEQIEYAAQRLGLANVAVEDAISGLAGQVKVYDVILLLDVLEHLELDYSVKLLKLIKSALRPRGVLLIQVPNALAPLSPNRYGDVTHLRAYTPSSMAQHLRMGGFIEIAHFELPPYIHGIASLIRRGLWASVVKPLIGVFMLIANSNRMGGIYTTNLLTVARREEGPSCAP